MLTAGDIGRYRDYPALMRRHERAQRVKRNLRIFTYSILITVIVLLFLIMISYVMVRWEKKRKIKQKTPAAQGFTLRCYIAPFQGCE